MAKCKLCGTDCQGRGALFKHMWHEHPKEAREQALQHLKPSNEHKVHPPEQEVLVHAIQQELEVIEQLYEDELDRLKNQYEERLSVQEVQLREEIALLKTQIGHKDQQIGDLNERIKEAHILLSQERHRTPEPSKKKHWWEFWKRG
jgi:hypothetical protein